MSRISVPAVPYDLEVPAGQAALVVIDMQYDFCVEGGYASAYGRDIQQTRAAIPSVRDAVAAARALDMLVVFTREGHRPDLSDCPPPKLERSRHAGAEIGSRGQQGRLLVRGELGNEFIPEMDVRPEDVLIDKPGKSAFFATDLDHVLRTRGVTHLVFCGVTTNICVHSTLRQANDLGYWTLTLQDACAAYELAQHEAAIDNVATGGGLFGWLSTTADFCNATAANR